MRPRGSAAGNSITAAVVVAGFAGYLLSSGVLDPALAGGITLAQDSFGRHRSPAPPRSDAGSMARVADWQYFDQRPQWSSSRGVPQISGPTSPSTPRRPSIAPPEDPIHWQFSDPGAMPHYSLRPRSSSCFQPRGPGHDVEQFTVTTGTGSATVSWWDLGDPDLIRYDLAAVPDSINEGNGTRAVVHPPTVTTAIAAPGTCKRVTATVSGLLSGQTYFFQLRAVNTSRVQAGVTYTVERAQSVGYLIG